MKDKNNFKLLTLEEIYAMGFVPSPSVHLEPGESPWCFDIPKDHPSGADTFHSLDGLQYYLSYDGFYGNLVGPARVMEGGSYEFWNGKGGLHRYDGPAICHVHNPLEKLDDDIDYYINDNYIRSEDYLLWLDECGMDIDSLTPEDKVIIDLKWGQDV